MFPRINIIKYIDVKRIILTLFNIHFSFIQFDLLGNNNHLNLHNKISNVENNNNLLRKSTELNFYIVQLWAWNNIYWLSLSICTMLCLTQTLSFETPMSKTVNPQIIRTFPQYEIHTQLRARNITTNNLVH